MNEFTRLNDTETSYWCVLFANNIILADKRKWLNTKLESYRDTLESKALALSRTRTKCT